jgi:hypothetical protein
MSRTPFLRLAAACVALASLSAHPHAQAAQRVAYVTVVDSTTELPASGVTADHIVIREDGNRREVLSVAPATSEMPVAVIIDNSAAAAPTINDLRKSLAALLTAIEGIGPVGLFTVASRPTILKEYTTSQKELLDAAGRLFHEPSSGATLLDTIADVSKGLRKRTSDRAAIIVVTGENTEFSNLQYRYVLDALRDSGAMMYAIVLTNQKGSLSTEEARNRATVLDRGPRDSGGVRYDVLTSMAFEPRLKVLGQVLKSQYRVTYARPQALIAPEKFTVSSGRPGFEVNGAPARGQDVK